MRTGTARLGKEYSLPTLGIRHGRVWAMPHTARRRDLEVGDCPDDRCVVVRTDARSLVGDAWSPGGAGRDLNLCTIREPPSPIGDQGMNKDQDVNKDRVKGGPDSAKGRVKEAPGQPMGGKKREDEGRAEHTRSQVQPNRGDRQEDHKRSAK
jgi:uncharacterized protein YjbJ (UPF0337 family)